MFLMNRVNLILVLMMFRALILTFYLLQFKRVQARHMSFRRHMGPIRRRRIIMLLGRFSGIRSVGQMMMGRREPAMKMQIGIGWAILSLTQQMVIRPLSALLIF